MNLPAEPLARDDLTRSGEVMAGLFAGAFDRETVALDDDFFELGGDSLIGAALMSAVEARFGVVLSMSTLLEAPTPRELAEAVLASGVSGAARCVIAVNPEGIRPTVFVVHGNTGDSVLPSRLSAALPNRALYAIRAIGLELDEKLPRATEEFAAEYLTGIEQVRPNERPLLLGHCGGAIIAYEMARQLTARGTPPAGLILADPEISEDFAPYLHKSGLALQLVQSAWRKRAAQLDEVLRKNPDLSGEVRRVLVAGGIKHAIGTYTPQPYHGPTLLMTSVRRRRILLDETRGFPTLLPDLDVFTATVGHLEMFGPGLQRSVAAIEGFIGRLDLKA
jgi:thioesterase domain-containing protein/acyl carrier protein